MVAFCIIPTVGAAAYVTFRPTFGWGSAPDPAGGAYSAPPDPLAGFKGAYF